VCGGRNNQSFLPDSTKETVSPFPTPNYEESKVKKLISLVSILSLLLSPVLSFAQAQSDVRPVLGAQYLHTTTIASTDTSPKLTALLNTAYGSTIDFAKVKAIILTVETADIRISFDNNATRTPAHGHVISPGQSFHIPSSSMIKAARVTSKTAATPGTMQVSFEY
jgi:hypothetical protein